MRKAWTFLQCLVSIASNVAQLETTVKQLEKKVKDMALDFSVLKAKVDAQGTVLDGIAADYVTLKAEIADLQAALDATDTVAMQAAIDELTATVEATNARMVVLDESVAPNPPVNP